MTAVSEALARLAVGGDAVVITRLPMRVDLVLYAGDFTLAMAVRDPDGSEPDLSGGGAVVRAHARATLAATAHVAFETELDGNLILLTLPAEAAARIPRRAVWDVKLLFQGRTTILAGGTITMTQAVTRDGG